MHFSITDGINILLAIIAFFAARTLSKMEASIERLNLTVGRVVTNLAVTTNEVKAHGKELSRHSDEIRDIKRMIAHDRI